MTRGKVCVIVGCSFGDEGKAKCVDYLGQRYDIGVRFNGGPNAGHTVVREYLVQEKEGLHGAAYCELNKDGQTIQKVKYVGHLLPATAIDGKPSVLTPGVCIDIGALGKEMDENGIDPTTVYVDRRCPVITEDNKTTDKVFGAKIGTTGKGMGPCMADQMKRTGTRIGDIENIIAGLDVCFCDTGAFLRNEIKNGKNVIFEGAQSYHLDIWHGTYPYVTSSCTTAGAVCTNAGIPPMWLDEIWGVFKAYSTRVGEGPMEEFSDEKMANKVREIGKEYGSTTGRPRRVGPINLNRIKEAVEANGCTHLWMNKADVLNGISFSWNMEGHPTGSWCWDSINSKAFGRFLYVVEQHIGRSIDIVGTGPGTTELVERVASLALK